MSSSESVVAGQVEQGVEQHRAVPGGEHEAVAVRPVRIGRVVLQVARPQHVRHGRCAHRQAGMAGVRSLHRVGREEADRVDCQRVEINRAARRVRSPHLTSSLDVLYAGRRECMAAARAKGKGGRPPTRLSKPRTLGIAAPRMERVDEDGSEARIRTHPHPIHFAGAASWIAFVVLVATLLIRHNELAPSTNWAIVGWAVLAALSGLVGPATRWARTWVEIDSPGGALHVGAPVDVLRRRRSGARPCAGDRSRDDGALARLRPLARRRRPGNDARLPTARRDGPRDRRGSAGASISRSPQRSPRRVNPAPWR